MKNCIISGFGRSGTSLMGGILYHSGYFMGEDLYPSRESNPKGFFENDVINGINEKILSEYDYINVRKTTESIAYRSSPFNPMYGQRWLSYIESQTLIDSFDDSIGLGIQKALAVPVFAYKDPRFNFTLPIWNRYLAKDVVYICMFREPDKTVESVLKDCQTADYLDGFFIDRDIAFQLWYNSYQRLFQTIDQDVRNRMIFIHYEQLLSREILPELSGKLEVSLDAGFISPELNRSRSNGNTPEYVQDLYRTLCRLSGFSMRL
ncbi:MAG: hypothetical protein NT040_03265 [Bacteroidetes bacterium]|nr:hypothetical protein [Bacteroidota bacterium]